MSGLPFVAEVAFTGITGVVAAVTGGSIAYLLMLLGVAARASQPEKTLASSALGKQPSFAVIIPAHNEEVVIEATLSSLKAQDYPAPLYEIVVLADNCSDQTAAIARGDSASNITVIERFNTDERGKGYALAEAVRHLFGRPGTVADAFVIVDADTWVAPDFLRRMADHLAVRTDAHGYCALQGRYGVLNADDGWRAALMAGAFDLFNHIKPLGRDRLGLSVGLKGNGMMFSRPVLEAAPFSGRSITEDIDYGLDLLRHQGIRVGYAPDALVRAQMPTTARQAASQRERWEGGRYKLLRERALPLLAEGVRRGDRRLMDAAFDLCLPPLAEIATLLLLWTVLVIIGARFGLLPGAAFWGIGVAVAFAGYVLYVLGGFAVAGAPRSAYAALLKAPGYAVWKLVLYALKPLRRLQGRSKKTPQGTTEEWVRTERLPLPKESSANPVNQAPASSRGREETTTVS